ncbi:MAG: TIGR03618 family F420-dependent PPOX class oxidoreductase, partial [Chloroflexi bacterium]|nr:TIGR03618 family F420-dependent PPOX class oxidoreductase [Chloroflexota bacterium]
VAAAAPGRSGRPFERHFGPVAPEDRDTFLRAMPNAIVATYRRETGPNLSPLWYLWTGEEFWISTLTWTAKVKNLRRDSRMSLCIDDPVGGEYVTAYGRAQIVEDGTVRERTLRLIRKYRAEEDVLPHWERVAADRVILILRPDEMVWRDW